jgi:hypothetical protein
LQVFKRFVVLTGITIAVLQGEVGLTQVNAPAPGNVAEPRCEIVSSTGGSLVRNATPPTELLPGRLMTVRVICDRPSIVSAVIEQGGSVLHNGRAEVALVSDGSSGVFKGLPTAPQWSDTATFAALATQGSGGDVFAVAVRVKVYNGSVLSAGNYTLHLKISVQPTM